MPVVTFWMLRVLFVALGLSAISGPVWAIPVQFTYTGTISATGIAGINSGDTVVITVIADNGGTSVIDQSWNQSDLLSATLVAGSYSASYGAPLVSDLDPAFRTDSSGNLNRAVFLGGVSGLNADSFGVGGSILLYDDSILDFYGNAAFLADPLSDPQSLGLWAGPSGVIVPVPSTLVLFASGVLALQALRRCHSARQATSQPGDCGYRSHALPAA